jgi:hypothetical protein
MGLADIFLANRTPDYASSISNGFESGMRMSDLLQQRSEERQKKAINSKVEEELSKGIAFGPDGSLTVAPNTISNIAKIAGLQRAGEEQQKIQQRMSGNMKFGDEQRTSMLNRFGDVAQRVLKNPAIFESEVLGLAKQGYPVQQLGLIDQQGRVIPYDEASVKAFYQQTPQYKQEIENQKSLVGIDKTKADIKNTNASTSKTYAEIGKIGQDAKRLAANGGLSDEKIQALTTPYGLARTEADAKALKTADEEKQNFDNKIQEMIDLRKKHSGGVTLNREDVARGKQLSKDALLSYKNMAKLGVLSQADEAIINAIIPDDPLEYSSPLAAIQGQDPILNNLVKFKEDKDKEFNAKLSNRLREGFSQQVSQKNETIANPKVGEIETHTDGTKWKFKGGNPADPSSWGKL